MKDLLVFSISGHSSKQEKKDLRYSSFDRVKNEKRKVCYYFIYFERLLICLSEEYV